MKFWWCMSFSGYSFMCRPVLNCCSIQLFVAELKADEVDAADPLCGVVSYCNGKFKYGEIWLGWNTWCGVKVNAFFRKIRDSCWATGQVFRRTGFPQKKLAKSHQQDLKTILSITGNPWLPCSALVCFTKCMYFTESQNHRITESQGWKRPIRSPSPTVFSWPLLPQALTHISQRLIQTPLEHCLGWRLHHLSGQAVKQQAKQFAAVKQHAHIDLNLWRLFNVFK